MAPRRRVVQTTYVQQYVCCPNLSPAHLRGTFTLLFSDQKLFALPLLQQRRRGGRLSTACSFAIACVTRQHYLVAFLWTSAGGERLCESFHIRHLHTSIEPRPKQ
jgi:hypothetical protein